MAENDLAPLVSSLEFCRGYGPPPSILYVLHADGDICTLYTFLYVSEYVLAKTTTSN